MEIVKRIHTCSRMRFHERNQASDRSIHYTGSRALPSDRSDGLKQPERFTSRTGKLRGFGEGQRFSMNILRRARLIAGLCLAIAIVAVLALTGLARFAPFDRFMKGAVGGARSIDLGRKAENDVSSLDFPLFSSQGFENAGYPTASRFTGLIEDSGSLKQVQDAIRSRARRGIEFLLAQLRAARAPGTERLERRFRIEATLGLLLMSEGKFEDADGPPPEGPRRVVRRLGLRRRCRPVRRDRRFRAR